MAKSRKRTSKGTVAIIISLITLAALITGILTDWFTNFKKYLPKRTGATAAASADDLYAPDAGLLISPVTQNGIMLYSASMPIASFAAYSLDENVEAVKTITARFTPADTTLQEVDYTAAWKNSSSSWATGKDVYDYISLTQSADGSLDCAVSLSDAIGEQIIITCTARPLAEGDWVPSATCTVDYYKRVTDASLQFYGWYNTDTNKQYTVDVKNGAVLNFADYYYEDSDDSVSYGNEVELIQTLGTGTVNDGFKNLEVSISISDEVASSLKTAAGVSSLSSFNVVKNGSTSGLYLETELIKILGGTNSFKNHKTAIYNALKAAYDAYTPALKVDISYTGKSSGITYNFTYKVHLNPLALGVKATGVNLDNSGIIFSLHHIPEETPATELKY